MDHVVDVVLFEELLVSVGVADIKFLVLAGEFEPLLGHIRGNYIVASELFAKCPHEGDANLALASGDQDAAILPRNDRLGCLDFLQRGRNRRFWDVRERRPPSSGGKSLEMSYGAVQHFLFH